MATWDLPIKSVYDKDPEELPKYFNPVTISKAVIIDEGGTTLDAYIEGVTSQLNTMRAPLKPINGKSIVGITVLYKYFPKEVNSIALLDTTDTGWVEELEEPNAATPSVWKRYKFALQEEGNLNAEVIESEWYYEFCGSPGINGADGTTTQWIYFKSNKGVAAPTITSNVDSEEFQQDDYTPNSNWKHAPESLTLTEVMYISTRTKENGKWKEFSPPALWSIPGEDGNSLITKKIYIAKNDGTPTLPSTNATLSPVNVETGLVQDIGDWSNTVPQTTNNIIWECTGYFNILGNLIRWEGPIRITGYQGERGYTGPSTEFMFIATSGVEPPELEFSDLCRTKGNESCRNYKYWFASAGEAAPNGTTTFVEWVIQRTKNELGEWILDPEHPERCGWSYPLKFTTYGTDGIDGDGIQFVYLRLTEAEYNVLKGNWNFDGGTVDSDGITTDEPTYGPGGEHDFAGITREKCSITVGPFVTNVRLTPTINDNGVTKSTLVIINVDENLKDTPKTTKGKVDVTIDGTLYKDFDYTITLTALDLDGVVYVNSTNAATLVTSSGDNYLLMCFTPSTPGVENLKRVIAKSTYIVSVIKNGVEYEEANSYNGLITVETVGNSTKVYNIVGDNGLTPPYDIKVNMNNAKED